MNCAVIQSAIALVLALMAIGCDVSSNTPQIPATTSKTDTPADKEQLLNAITELERESQNSNVPPPAINLQTPPGWSKSEPRPLPADDHGFTIAYEHDSGMAVTFYQFTRGLNSIPNDVNSAPVKNELRRAKSGIQQAVELGYWQSAQELKTDTVVLGDSDQKAHWSQYQLTIDDTSAVSDIYVWSFNDTLFKLRCTNRFEDVTSNQNILKPLLTSLGSQ